LSLELVALSFFKSKNISYHYVKPIIKFPCIQCSEEAVMHSYTTNWSCNSCGIQGTISKLIEFEKENWNNTKIYNPNSEKNKIINLFNELIVKDDSKKMKNLKSKVEELLEYYESKV
jgi:ribosomal protein L37AE/L43A